MHPAGGPGNLAGRGGDAEAEPLRERRQQAVHGRRLCLPVLLIAAAAHWLLHPDGGWDLPCWVKTRSQHHQPHTRLISITVYTFL